MVSIAQHGPGRTGISFDLRARAWPLLILLLAAAAVAIGWTGFMASDDQLYYFGSLHWVETGPFAGDSHWTTRFPLVLTLAAAIAVFGAGPGAMAATALAWYAAFVGVGWLLARRLAGEPAAWIAALLLATMPVIATAGSIVNCDLPEATFLMLGAWLLAGEMERPSVRRCLGAGLAFGAAILCRETAVLALFGLGLLFLAGRPLQRRAIFIAGCGAALVLLGEAAFQWVLTGDPLHRYGLAFNHDSSLDRAANEEGNLLVHPAIDPLLVLLVNNEFALLFWLLVPALVALRRSGGMDWRRFAVTGAMGVASFALIAMLSHKLVLNPRYFLPAAIAATMIVAAWVARLQGRWALLVLGGAVTANLAMLSLQNGHLHWDSEALVLAATQDPARAVTAERRVVERAELPLAWAGLTSVRADGDYRLLPAGEAGKAQVAARFEAPWRPAGALLALAGIRVERLRTGPEMVLVRCEGGRC